MDSTEPLIRRVAGRVHGRLPSGTEKVISPLYYRYLSWSADRGHNITGNIRRTGSDTPDHVLIFIIDALRPDFTPDIPLSFERAISPSTWTFPSVTSIHTGEYPHQHGAVAHTHPDDDSYAIPKQTASDTLLPQLFERYGFETYSGCAFITPFLAIRQWYQKHRMYGGKPAQKVITDYLHWRENKNKTFAYLHTGDLHEPIDPPETYLKERGVDTSLENIGLMTEYTDTYDESQECSYFREQRLKLYQSALDYVSDALGRLLDTVADDTVVIVAGDHGEAHWEHFQLDREFTDSRPNYGVGHGGTPFDMVARVPVAVHFPDRTIKPNGGWASLIDIPSTLSSACLNENPFSSLDWSEEIPEDRVTLCEGVRYGTERKASYFRQYKLIKSKSDEVTLSARVLPDSGEQFGPIPSEAEQTLNESFPDMWDNFDRKERPTKSVESRLKALGYK